MQPRCDVGSFGTIDIDDLPESIAYMATVIGMDATLQIVSSRGGSKLYVPTNSMTPHWLQELIGETAFTKLVEHYRGDEIEIPKCQQALSNAKARALAARRAEGESVSTLAAEYGMTMRGVRKACERAALL